MWGGVRRFPPRERQRGCGTADARPRCHRTFGERSTGAGLVAGLSSPGSVTFKDMNTLRIVTPTLSPGPQQLVLISPDGESVAFDAAFFAQ